MVVKTSCADQVILRGLTLANVISPGPAIVKRIDQDFIQSLLNQLAASDGLSKVAASRVNPALPGTVSRLYQPVHRVFNIALLEVACDQFGQPRLDPERIESAGLVIRRERKDTTLNQRSRMEAWVQSANVFRGWTQFDSSESEDLDPDPKLRKPERRMGHPWIDQLLSASTREPLQENETRLFLAPPEVCKAANKTILFGLIPVTSSEQTEIPDPNMPIFSDDVITKHLPSYLRAGGPRSIPQAGQRLNYRAGDTTSADLKDTDDTNDLGDFILMLRQLSIEFEAFKEPLATNAVYQALNAIQLPFAQRDGSGRFIGSDLLRPAGEFLKDALDILVNRRGQPRTFADSASNAPTITMPERFPIVTPEQAAAIRGSVKTSMTRRLNEVAGRPGRFDDPGRQYRLRAFIRLKCEEGCPPVLVWSDYSEPFTIVPWYESSDAPPTQVALPEITPNFLKNLKPNVSFVVPESLFNMLNKNSPADLINGNAAQAGAQLALDWICSFNIPIITICAFIVLNIFLQLFDIVFHWLLFIKICLPFPKTSQGGSS
jgi:hypothetical protein